MYQKNHSQKKPIIKFLFVLCFSFLNSPAFSQPEINSSTEESVLPSVWKISNSSFAGTAFAIGSNQMITSFHMLSNLLGKKGSLEKIVLTQSGSSSQIKIQRVIKVSALYDIVVFETKETVSNYLEFTKDSLNPKDFFDPKEKLSIVGYPNGVLNILQQTGNIYQVDSFSYFPANEVGVGGASGSPVLNTQGEVVGVIHSTASNLFYFTKASDIQKILSEKELTPCSSLSPVKCLQKEIKNLKKMAEQGSAFAQNMLAHIYEQGNGITKINKELALEWYTKSAEQGFALSQTQLAVRYETGVGTEGNYDLALELLKKAAEQNLAIAKSNLAAMYMKDRGIEEPNYDLAFELFKEAAEMGFAPAQYSLAVKYETGVGTEGNYDLALEWYEKSARMGFAPAQYLFAMIYYRESNRELYFYWMKKAAEKGYEPAQKILNTIQAPKGFKKKVKKIYVYQEKVQKERTLPILKVKVSDSFSIEIPLPNPKTKNMTNTASNQEEAQKINEDLIVGYKKPPKQDYTPAEHAPAPMYKEGFGTKVKKIKKDLIFYGKRCLKLFK